MTSYHPTTRRDANLKSRGFYEVKPYRTGLYTVLVGAGLVLLSIILMSTPAAPLGIFVLFVAGVLLAAGTVLHLLHLAKKR